MVTFMATDLDYAVIPRRFTFEDSESRSANQICQYTILI